MIVLQQIVTEYIPPILLYVLEMEIVPLQTLVNVKQDIMVLGVNLQPVMEYNPPIPSYAMDVVLVKS